jgi:hypothetical protein
MSFMGFTVKHGKNAKNKCCLQPVTVAAQSKEWTVFARSKAGVVGSNPTRGMDVWVYYVFVLSCV